MICIKLNGGLGNQMFQYALGRSLSAKHNCQLFLDISALSNLDKTKSQIIRNYELEIFDVTAKIATRDILKKIKPPILKIINTLTYILGFKGINFKNYYIEQSFSFDYNVLNVSNNCFLSGYWQSHKYFSNIENILKKEFQFPLISDKLNLELMNSIQNKNSVSIHVRRGDFLNNAIHRIHGTCSIDYYRSAIQYIESNLDDIEYFVFSDAIDWVVENLKFKKNVHFVIGNYSSKSFVDMHLMSKCKHNIIANSSFSWWGAWLNDNPNKIVVAPKKWFAHKELNFQTNDLIPDSWIRI